MEFKDRLKRLRAERGVTQEALGHIIHVSRSAIAKWEAGLGMPSEDSVQALCAYFKIDRAVLFPHEGAEVLLVEKNVAIYKNKVLVTVLSVLLGVVLILGGIWVTEKTVERRRDERAREQLVPTVTRVYFPEKPLHGTSEDRVYLYEGNYMLLQDDWVTVYIELVADERLMDGYASFTVDFEGVGREGDAEHTLTQTPVLIMSEPIDAYVRTYTYTLEFWTGKAQIDTLKIERLTFIQVLDGVRTEKAAIVEAASLPISMEEDNFVTLDVKLNDKTVISFRVPKGQSVNEALFDGASPMMYKELMLQGLIEAECNSIPGVGGKLQFEGWHMEDGSDRNAPLFRRAALVADVSYHGDDLPTLTVSAATVDNNGVRLFEACEPRFWLDGESYGNVKYTLSCHSDCVKIVEGGTKIKGVKPGTATVTVSYDLGFATGQASFDVTVVDYARVEFFPLGRIKLFWSEAAGDLLLEGEPYESIMAQYEAMNGDVGFEELTGHTRRFVGLERVDEVTFVPVFESDYAMDDSFIRLSLDESGATICADALPEVWHAQVGDVLSPGFVLIDSPWDSFSCVTWTDAPEGVLVDGVATETGEVRVYYAFCFEKGGVRVFSDIYALRIIIE